MQASTQHRAEKGIALVTALLMLLLLSSLAVGFTLLVTSEQQSTGLDLDHTKTFYAAYGAMEQVNAQVGTLFFYNPQHVTAADITNAIGSLPALPGFNLTDPANYCPAGDYTGSSNGYCVSYPKDANGNPQTQSALITQGPYQGFQGLVTNYTITINAQSNNFSLTTDEAGNAGTNRFGSEIRLRRTFQTVAIPVFQFGIFSQTDLSFFPGPNFNFGGKVATNGDLYLAGGSDLVLSDKVSAYGDVIRDELANGYSGSAYTGSYPGSIYPTTSPSGAFTGTPPPPVPPYRSLAFTEGSISGPSGGCVTATGNPVNTGLTLTSTWTTISLGSYNGNLRNGAYGCPRGTGAKNLQLPLLSPTAVSQGATAIALIKEPPSSENPSTSPIFPYRFFSYPTGAGYAMMRILIADTPGELLAEPTVTGPSVTGGGYPLPLFCLPPFVPGNPCTRLDGSSAPTNGYTGVAIYTNATTGSAPALPISGVTGAPAVLPPWAASGGVVSATQNIGETTTVASGDWYKQGQPRLWGYLKVEYQDGTSGGNWVDVTQEILSLGTTGRNLTNNGAYLAPNGSANPGNPTSGSGNGDGVLGNCHEPYPNAVLRFQRLADVPSNHATYGCGYPNPASGASGPTATSTQASDYVPLMLFDTREGLLRDKAPNGLSAGGTGVAGGKPASYLTASGAMYYVELDVNNLARWFTGAIGKSGRPATGVTGYLVYFSDRRGNQPCSTTLGSCPNSTAQKVGNMGFEDFVNPTSTTGVPDGVKNTGEDLNGANATLPGSAPVSMPLDTYGQVPVFECYPLNSSSTCPAPSPYTNVYTAPYPMPSQSNTSLLNTASACPATPSGTSLNPPTGPNLQCPSTATKLYTPTTGQAPPYTVMTIDEARSNPALFFRRALKLTDAQAYNLGNCGTAIPCGLTIASENPVYVEGNYNSGGASSFTGTDYPSAIIADSVTLLSINWNDVNSYLFPYSWYPSSTSCSTVPNRCSNTTYYRMGILAGKGLSFPISGVTGTLGTDFGQDYGTDGGVHNFLRYIENWGGQTLNYTGSIASFYFNTQGVGVYKCCNTVYSPPTRGYSFNTNYLTPTLLPPRTPAFTDTNTLGFTQLILPGQN